VLTAASAVDVLMLMIYQVDGWTGGHEMTSVVGQGHNDLENDVVRRRHVTGEGRNGDTSNTAGATLTGKILVLMMSLPWLSCWCSGSALDSQSKGRWFDSRPGRYQVKFLSGF